MLLMIIHVILSFVYQGLSIAGIGTKHQPNDSHHSLFGGLNDTVPFLHPLDLGRDSIKGISALAVGKLDQDEWKDVVVMDGGKHANGRLTFAWLKGPANPEHPWQKFNLPLPQDLRQTPPKTPFIGSLALSDIDGDSDQDIIFTMDKHSGDTMLANIIWMENLLSQPEIDSDWRIHYIARNLSLHHINDLSIADFDLDHRPDVIVRSLEPNPLLLFFQNHDDQWTMKSIGTSFSGERGEGFAVGDIDHSHGPDISIAGYWLQCPANPRTMKFHIYAIDTLYKKKNSNTKEVIADLDQDGWNDVLISPAEGYRDGKNHELAWYRSPGSFDRRESWKKQVLLSNYNGGHTVKVGDLNMDGFPDIMAASSWNMWQQQKSIRLFLSDGKGSFSSHFQWISDSLGLYSGHLDDMDNDGDLDIIGQDGYSGESRPWLFLNQTVP